jgi:hypothetical protein
MIYLIHLNHIQSNMSYTIKNRMLQIPNILESCPTSKSDVKHLKRTIQKEIQYNISKY